MTDAVLWIRIEARFEGQKLPTKIVTKNLINLIFLSAGCSLLRAEGISCILDGKKFFSCIFFFNFLLGSGLDLNSLEMLDPDPYPDPDSMNPNPQHWTDGKIGKGYQ
jgi:hypothetical protein